MPLHMLSLVVAKLKLLHDMSKSNIHDLVKADLPNFHQAYSWIDINVYSHTHKTNILDTVALSLKLFMKKTMCLYRVASHCADEADINIKSGYERNKRNRFTTPT